MALSPTSGGQTMALVYGPSDWYQAFRQDSGAHFAQALDYVSPDMAALVDGATRVSGFFMTNDQTPFIREVSGDGWALVGDAA